MKIFDKLKFFTKILHIKVFLTSLLIGLIFIYLKDSKKKIKVYPTLSNINNIEYKDKADNCYEYELEKINCPNDESKINKIPVY